jgi:hypothetical protein
MEPLALALASDHRGAPRSSNGVGGSRFQRCRKFHRLSAATPAGTKLARGGASFSCRIVANEAASPAKTAVMRLSDLEVPSHASPSASSRTSASSASSTISCAARSTRFERSGAVPADHPSRPEGARVSSPVRLLSSSECSLQGPGANREARFLTAQAGCIPTPISSKATPSPSAPVIVLTGAPDRAKCYERATDRRCGARTLLNRAAPANCLLGLHVADDSSAAMNGANIGPRELASGDLEAAPGSRFSQSVSMDTSGPPDAASAPSQAAERDGGRADPGGDDGQPPVQWSKRSVVADHQELPWGFAEFYSCWRNIEKPRLLQTSRRPEERRKFEAATLIPFTLDRRSS